MERYSRFEASGGPRVEEGPEGEDPKTRSAVDATSAATSATSRCWAAATARTVRATRAGAFGRQQTVPRTPGTLPTYGPLFAGMLTGVVVIVAGLTYFPVLALGPLAEGLS